MLRLRRVTKMWIFRWYVKPTVFWPVVAFVLVLLVAMIAECAAVKTATISEITVFGFAGQRSISEVATKDADVTYKVQHRISGTWTDIEPDGTSPDDVFTVFSGMSDRWSVPIAPFAVVADSTRVIVTPESATDVTVRVQ